MNSSARIHVAKVRPPTPAPPSSLSLLLYFLSPTCCVKLHELDVRLSGKHACSVCQMWRWENRWVINELVSVTELEPSPSTHGWMWEADSPRRISQCWTVSVWLLVLEPEDLIWTRETWPHASKEIVSFSLTRTAFWPTFLCGTHRAYLHVVQKCASRRVCQIQALKLTFVTADLCLDVNRNI